MVMAVTPPHKAARTRGRMAGERKLPLHVWLYGPSHRIHTRNNKNMHTSETKTRTFNLDGALSSLMW